jgi:ligand-binding sensor domain-containing protein/two-component sensor histidine kinase
LLRNINSQESFFKIFLLLISLIILKAPIFYPQINEIRFDRILPADGLVHDIVTSIVQDKYGFIWIGTEDGLMKYDSYTFTVFKNDPDSVSSLRDDWITRMMCDSRGRLWIGTALGLDRFDEKSSSFIHYTFPAQSNKEKGNNGIGLIYEDNMGEIFSYSYSGGLLVYNSKKNVFEKNEKVKNLESKFSGQLTSFLQDSEGTYWIATINHLLKWSSEKNFKYYKKRSDNQFGLSNSLIFDLCEDNDNIWIATERGLNKLNKKSGIIKKYFPSPGNPNSLCDEKVLDLYKDSNGNLWIGTYTGLNKYKPDEDNFYCFKNDRNDPYSISANRIYAVTEDRAGTIWIGTYKGGISKIDEKMNRFSYYGHNPLKPGSLSGDIVRSIFKDKEGNLWVGTDGEGINKYNSKTKLFKHYKYIKGNSNSLQSNSILWVTGDRVGNIWAATFGGGLSKYIPGIDGFKTYRADNSNGLLDDRINVIYIDKEDDFWVGTEAHGLFRFDPVTEQFSSFMLEHLHNQNIHTIFQDSDGYLWVGIFGGGLYRINKLSSEIKKYVNNPDDPFSISSNVIYAINEDKKKNIWISTFRGGLNLFNKEKERFVCFKEKQGLPSNYIKAAIADDNNILWLLTNKGLARFDVITREIKVFDEKDGLRSGDFLSGAYFLDDEGKIYAGGSKGFISFNPSFFKESNYLPPVVLTNFKVMDKPYNSGIPLTDIKEITLDYNQNFISFEFAALEFSTADKNQYAYYLSGIDRDWVFSGKRRYASYTHLDPGKYIFKVKAANTDGIWGNESLNIYLTINPPFWLTWWFRILSLILAVALFYILYRYRIRRLLEIERIKNRLASDLHDDIATNLSSIAMFSQIVQDESKKSNTVSPMMNQLMEKITAMSQDSVSSIRDIIWAIDPKQETIYDLLIRARDSFIMHCRAKNINFNLDSPDKEHLPDQNLSPEERKNIWLLIKEAITNSIKHSRATEISLHAVYKNHLLNLVIIDNGKGFDTSSEYTGKGMTTMKKRAENLGGDITIVSDGEQGTIINFQLKIK